MQLPGSTSDCQKEMLCNSKHTSSHSAATAATSAGWRDVHYALDREGLAIDRRRRGIPLSRCCDRLWTSTQDMLFDTGSCAHKTSSRPAGGLGRLQSISRLMLYMSAHGDCHQLIVAFHDGSRTVWSGHGQLGAEQNALGESQLTKRLRPKGCSHVAVPAKFAPLTLPSGLQK